MTITKKHHHLHGGERWLLLCCAAEMYKWNLLIKLNIDKATLDFYYCFSIGSRVTTEDFDVTETCQDAIDTSHHSVYRPKDTQGTKAAAYQLLVAVCFAPIELWQLTNLYPQNTELVNFTGKKLENH